MPTVPVEYLWLAAALVAAGVISGFLAGFFGIGGGAPIVFALYETFRALGVSDVVRMHICIGSALAVMVPTAVVSYLGHRKRGSVDDTIAKAWALPVVLGVAAGSGVAAVASQAALKLVFAVLAALNGVKMLSNRLTWRLGRDTPTLPETAAAGFVTGLLSSLMGIGGGVFGNMFLSLYGRPMHQVVGTSASLGVLIGVAGTIGYMVAGLPHEGALPFGSIGFVSLPALLLVAPLAALCAPLGVRIAHRFSPQRLKQAFGVFLLVLSARFWASLAFGV